MKLGLALPHYDFSFPDARPVTVARVVDYARRAEDLGFDSVWVSDHLFLDLSKYGGPPARYGTPEALSLLGAIAAATSRVRLGPLVMCAPLRNAVVAAEQLRTIHEASGGRLEVGVGAGWYEPEFAEAGIPFGTVGERITFLDGYAAVLRDRLKDGPRIFVGGKGGPRIMRIVAEAADGWNVVWAVTPEDYRQRLAVLDRTLDRAGRARSSVRLTVGLSTLIGTSEDDLAARYARLQAWTPGGALDGVRLEDWARGRLVGTPERCAEVVRAFEGLGVDEIILGPASLPFSLFEDGQLDLAARALAPLVG
jgi:alkanesulfonate monooxygenase SsuD/methylene tetrahydromethanopterin reductase-like flavin-dependent oxidoreductase (luciferase family)